MQYITITPTVDTPVEFAISVKLAGRRKGQPQYSTIQNKLQNHYYGPYNGFKKQLESTCISVTLYIGKNMREILLYWFSGQTKLLTEKCID